jgi:hypothetical protein
MKKLSLAAFALICAISVFAQGEIRINTRVPGNNISHVYAPLASNIYFSQLGNGSASGPLGTTDFPAGTTDWTGFSPIGSAGLAGQYGASSTFAQLLIAPGFNRPESELVPQTPVATFRTGNAAGFTQGGITVTASNVELDAPATIKMVVWDNSSGQYPTWMEAHQAWIMGNIAAAESGSWNAVLGGTSVPPNLDGVRSLNLYYYLIPEPCCFALAVLGLAALLVCRRGKQ